MQVEALTLEGRFVRLEPLRLEHALGLLAAADKDTFALTIQRPDNWDHGGFRLYCKRLIEMEGCEPFAVVLREDNRVCGVTTYLDIRPEHRGLEIGQTWLGRDFQGTAVNPEMKLMMLGHAFTELNALRVQLKTDARNEQSQRAIEKLGAVREGVLRRHIILTDGHVRDTVMYSIIDTEYERVAQGLRDRLARFTAWNVRAE